MEESFDHQGSPFGGLSVQEDGGADPSVKMRNDDLPWVDSDTRKLKREFELIESKHRRPNHHASFQIGSTATPADVEAVQSGKDATKAQW